MIVVVGGGLGLAADDGDGPLASAEILRDLALAAAVLGGQAQRAARRRAEAVTVRVGEARLAETTAHGLSVASSRGAPIAEDSRAAARGEDRRDQGSAWVADAAAVAAWIAVGEHGEDGCGGARFAGQREEAERAVG